MKPLARSLPMDLARWKRPPIKWVLLFAAIFVFWSLYFMYRWNPDGSIFRDAALALISGQSPYAVKGFFNPPWALFPVVPLLLLPDWMTDSAVSTINALCFFLVAYKMGARNWMLPFVILAPSVIDEMWCVNNTGISALGVILPPQIGLFFVLIKPHIGAPIALFWLVEAWRKGRLHEVMRVFGPVIAGSLLSILLYGLWPLNASQPIGAPWNFAPWPVGIPVGLVLLIRSFHDREIRYAMLATPFLTPYLAFHGYTLALLGLLPSISSTIAGVVGLWLFLAVNGGWHVRKF
jgi:hypothetical protein